MRHTWIAAIAGAACGAAAAWIVAARPGDVSSSEGDDRLAAAVVALEDATRLLRAALAAARPTEPATPDVRPPEPPREGDRPVAETSPPSLPPAARSEPFRVAGRTPLPSADRDAVAAMKAWPLELRHDDEGDEARQKGLRRRWLFATEAEVLAAFGAPDEVHGGSDEETWVYWQWDGRERVPNIHLVFWNGRLRRVQ